MKQANENTVTEILEPLHTLAVELMEIEQRGNTYPVEYTELDTLAAITVFNHVLLNKRINHYFKTGMSDVKQAKKEAEEYTDKLIEIVKEMTGINIGKEK